MGMYSEILAERILRKEREMLNEDFHYEPSSATAYMDSFSHIVDVIGDYPLKKVTKKELLKKDILDEEWLQHYVNWGILEIKDGYWYSLTVKHGLNLYGLNIKWRMKKNEV